MGDREMVGLVGLGILFVLLMLRIPVGLAMVAVGIGGNYALSEVASFLRFGPYLKQFKTLFFNSVANYDLSVVPLFILMGYLASETGMSRDLFQGMRALVGRVRGGVAMAAITACAGFGAVCGSSLATASTMGKVALPELRRMNYSVRLATGTLAAGGTLGILIPPSVALIVYALIVEASIIDMFQAAMVPGLIAVAFFVATIALIVRIRPDAAPALDMMETSERRIALRRLIPILIIFLGIILGLGFGLFTPTPAAAIGVFAMLAYGLVVRSEGRGITFPRLGTALRETAVTAGMIAFILFGAEVLKGFFSRAGLPAAMADWAGASGYNPWVVLIAMLAVLIFLGCFMESLAMVLVVVPFFWPALVEINGGDYAVAETAAFGMSNDDLKLWFGILALVVVELGLITPPVGLNVFIISALARDVPISETFKGVMPFFGVEILRIALLLCLPGLCLWLPGLLSG